MNIHELNNFTGTLGSGAYLAIDDGTDTGKISSQGLLAATEARIDNIIAGPAPSAEEIVDARLGADGVPYPSLGDAIRDQFTDVKSDLNVTDECIKDVAGVIYSSGLVFENGSLGNPTNPSVVNTSYAPIGVGTVTIDVKRPLDANGAYYAFGYALYDSSKTLIGTINDYGRQVDLNKVLNILNTSVKYIRYTIAEVSTSDTYIALRKTDFDSHDVVVQTVLNDSITHLINDSYKKQTVTIPAGQGSYQNFYFIKGRRYKYTNNSNGSVNLYLYRADNTSVLITSSLSAGASLTFTSDDEYVKFSSYFNGTGTGTMESVDGSVFSIANDGTDALANTSDLYNAVNAVGAFHNFANPADFIDGSVWSSATGVYPSSGWHRTELTVKPNHKYTLGGVNLSFAWMLNDNTESLGAIPSNSFTTPNTCTKIRISGSNSTDIVCLDAEVSGTINSTLYPFGKWFSVTNPDDLKELLKKNVTLYDYTSVSMFPSIGVVGDSYESGGIYIDEDVWGMFYDSSWVSVMGRRCGSTMNNYSSAGLSTRTWLTDSTRGLAKALSDTASGLYLLCLGINDYGIENYLGTIADIKSDYTQNPDTFYGNYAKIFEQLQAHAPNAKFIFVVPPLITSEYATAIEAIASHYNVPSFRSNSDDFFKSDFYIDNKGTAHPVAMTYAGMAKAYERLVSLCIQNNETYFYDYHAE